ncbi:unnamed protein product [Caenorhabditis sp. 36 PRJEB53466]|nr:unnamed protein product [Caenorhabditis sp. 36 PRJEB53466]
MQKVCNVWTRSDHCKFFRTQLVPFLKAFPSIPKDLNITYHPFSYGSKRINGSIVADCANGALECELCKLQSCSKKYFQNANSTALLSLASCLQDQRSVDNAKNCLPNGKTGDLIADCASSIEGDTLFLAEPFPPGVDSISLPWIVINGEHVAEAYYNFRKFICQLESAKRDKRCLRK